MKLIYFFSIIIFVITVQKTNAQYPNPPYPWHDDYNISIEDFDFEHPMTVLNAKEIDLIKKRIEHDIEPQKSAFLSLINEAETSLGFTPNAPQTLDIPGGYVDSEGLEYAREVLWSNCHPAYTCALAYTFTDSLKYANKAIEILMHWANKGTSFTGDDRGLQLGSYFSPMLYAADLLYNYNGWSESEKQIFKNWWRQECVNEGDVHRVMRQKDNNWKDAALLGMFSASVVLEDTAYMHESLIQLKSYFHARSDEYVRLPGKSWKIASDGRGIYLPREVVRNDGRSGLSYTAYALTTMVQCFEVARYAGYNYWNDTTEHGVGIKDVINQYYKWDILKEDFPWNDSPKRLEKRRNSYEVANTRVELNDDISVFLANNRPVMGREGDAYSSLNKGNMLGWDTLSLDLPTIIEVEPLSSNQIKIKWTNVENEYGYCIERKSNSGYIVLDSLKSNTNEFIDKNLVDNSSYTYRIKVYNYSGNAASSEKTATTQLMPTEIPAAPSDLNATVKTTNEILLSWIDNANNEDGFVIMRKTNEAFDTIATVGVNDTLFVDDNLDLNSQYTYQVFAFNNVGNSANSNEATGKPIMKKGVYNETDGIISMEAENGDVGVKWEIKSDLQYASGGKYIEMTPDLDHINNAPDCILPECLSAYYFNVTNSGNYAFWFRILSEGGEDDSYFWRIDGGEWIRENGRSGIGGWFKTDNKQTDNLEVGNHILEIAYRENGTKLDKFVIQLDSKEDPKEKGPAESLAFIEGWPPRYPGELKLMTKNSDSIQIRWDDYANNEDGFIIERHSGDEFIKIGEVGANVLNFIDTTFIGSTYYKYRVKAFNQFGSSNYSNILPVLSSAETSSVSKYFERYQIQIFPNPASQIFNVVYFVPHKSQMDISIYDMLGRKVKTLFNGEKLKGNYTESWDCNDLNGIKLSGGVYFMKFSCNENTTFLRFLLT
jgi:hypothetical protein